MSDSFALIRFNKTKNIYYGAYVGTVDLLLPAICLPEECYNKEFDYYNPINYCRKITYNTSNSYRDLSQEEDLDDVEIYSDYGGGFYWFGKGSESLKLIDNFSLDPWRDSCPNDGIPLWVIEFLNEIEK